MPSMVWTPQHAASLKALRTQAGLDPYVLAKRHNLSATQVRQLEEGGDSAFYSAHIKALTGRKLIFALGGSFIEEVSEAAPSFPMPPVATTTKPQAAVYWASGLGLAAVSALAWTWLGPTGTMPSTAPPSVAIQIEKAPVHAIDTNNALPESERDQPNLIERPEAEPPAFMMPATLADRSPASSSCAWIRNAPDLTPAEGSRPDNYVHLVALQNTAVCWRDADNKTRQHTLQAGESVSFWGTPPFQLYAVQPGAIKVYFRGQLVRWADASGANHILLDRRLAATD